LSLAAVLPAAAQTPSDGSRVVRDFRLKSGEVLPGLRLHGWRPESDAWNLAARQAPGST